MTEVSDNCRSLYKSWIHQWGSSISEIILDPSTLIFRAANIDGIIGYRIASGCAVVFSDPICAIDDIPQLVQAFHSYCEERKLTIIYIIATEQFAQWALKNLGYAIVEVGEELVFDPQNDPTASHRGYKLRNYIHHAQHLGLTVHEYLLHDKAVEEAIDQVGAEWLKARQGPQIHLSDLNFFGDRTGKRWFYVQQNGRIIAMALLSQTKAHQGWLLKFLIAVPESTRGTTELLMMSILHTLRSENCHHLTYGIVPLERLGKIVGLSQFSAWLARIVYKITTWIFRLNRRKMYWQKFQPLTQPSYVLFSKPSIRFKEILAVIKVLKGHP